MSAQINLFNPAFVRRKQHFSAKTMAQAGMVLVAGIMLQYAYLSFQMGFLEDAARRSTADLTKRQAHLAKLTAEFTAKAKSPALQTQVEELESDLKAVSGVSTVLQKGAFHNTTGFADYLRAFARQVQPGIWLTGFDIADAGNAIVLQGRALRPELVPAFIGRLAQEAALKGKSFATLDMQLPKKPSTPAASSASAPVSYIEFELRSKAVVPEGDKP
jgi:hypothetical protein